VLLVIIGVLLVKTHLTTVLLVQKLLTDLNYHVIVILDIMMMVLKSVKSVTLNVKLVKDQMVVLLVLKEESAHHIVHAQKENSPMLIISVNLVPITVIPVKPKKAIV